jgi:hypothetical protein
VKWFAFIALFLFACNDQSDCVRFDIEKDKDYKSGYNGVIWASSNAAQCTIYVNKQIKEIGKLVRYDIKKGDNFKVTKSQVNFQHTFQSWFDCEE